MSAAMDVAYLDLPYVAHLRRAEMMMRMSPQCWEDGCHDCCIPGCICACHDELPPGPAPTVTERINRLADSIGAR